MCGLPKSKSNQDLCERILRQGAPGSLARSNLQQNSRGLDVHLRVIANFVEVLLQTDRYNGSPFVLHMNLPIELEHFERWLVLFEETVKPHYRWNMLRKRSPRRGIWRKFQAGIFRSSIVTESPPASGMK